MSRFYDVMYLVKTSKPKDVKDMLVEQAFVLDDDTTKIASYDYNQDTQIMSLQGEAWLNAGQCTEERHNEFIEALAEEDPEATGISRWHLAEFVWDDEYGEDDEGIFDGY